MLEKDFQNLFNKWVKAKYNYSAAFELKITKKDNIPFSSIQKHQIESLQAVENHKLVYKISDSGIGFKPFDSFCMSSLPAYVVVLFYKARSVNTFYGIRINKWVEEDCMSTVRRSLTQQRASEICEFSDTL